MQFITLSNGQQIPSLGYGVFMIPKKDCKRCVLEALKVGYRHLDTAQIYQNEQEVGEALAQANIPREELFITGKVWVSNYGYKKAKASIERTLKRLGIDYIDLMLLHRPYANYKGAWMALEEGVKDGKIRSIGLSNFDEKETRDILSIATIMPVVNQIECHPFGQQNGIRGYLEQNNLALEAWYPLGHGNKELLSNIIITNIAKKYNKEGAQVILRWHLQRGHIVFPKTVRPERMASNFEVFDFALTDEEMEAINNLDRDEYVKMPPKWLDTILALLKRT